MKYKLVDPHAFIQGLPNVPELDDSQMSIAEKALLDKAVAAGIYAPAVTEKPAKKKAEDNEFAA